MLQFVKLYFSQMFFVIHQSFFHSTNCSINSRRFRIGIRKWGPANHHWEDTLHITSILFCSIFLALRDRSSGWNVWWWRWEEHEERRGERPHRGAVKLSTSRTTGLWSKAAWFMGYGLPHWEETIQFPYEDTAVVAARTHASSCSVTVLHQKYPGYFLWMEIF